MFLQWCGEVLPKIYIFVQRLVSGTGRGFASAPLKKHKRCGPFVKMRQLLKIWLLTILLTACSTVDDKPIFDPFEINYNVTEKSLIDSDYKVMPEDVPLLGKQIGDTLIYYQLNYECDSLTLECVNTNVSHRFCYIYLDKADTLMLQKLTSKYDSDIISPFIHKNEIIIDGTNLDSTSHSTWSFHGTFFVQHRFTKQIFECYIGQASGMIDNKTEGYELTVNTDFPWTLEQIKKNGWIYK
jgi:hypothetical protein